MPIHIRLKKLGFRGLNGQAGTEESGWSGGSNTHLTPADEGAINVSYEKTRQPVRKP